jgi:hypothetical protein
VLATALLLCSARYIVCVCVRHVSTVKQATAAVPLLIAHTRPTVYTVYACCSLPSHRQPLLFDWSVFETIRGDFDKWLVTGLKQLRTDLEESAARR